MGTRERQAAVHQESATSRRHGEFAWTLGTGAGSVSAARQAFVSWLAELADHDELLEDMSVVVSELASNAIESADHVEGGAEVRAELDGDVINVEVSNRVPDGITDIRHWDLDDPLRGGGRGLMIVRAYTDSLVVESTEGTVTVRCSRRLTTAS